MNMKQLIVAECFYSLQCEGRSIGTPAVFLRLAGCNLLCKGNGWTCDTIEVWQKGRATDFDKVIKTEWLERLMAGHAHLVITGGEPLLHQKVLSEYLDWLFQIYKIVPFIEIETNGTIMPNIYLKSVVKYWNVSPKLSNSGEPLHKRINEVVLTDFDTMPNTIFKFVIATRADVLECLQDFEWLDIRKWMFMPAGATRLELKTTRPIVVRECMRLGIPYSERLHIVIWNKKTGV